MNWPEMNCPYGVGDRVTMRYGLATVRTVHEHDNTSPPSWTLGVVADVGQYWLCSQEEITALNDPAPACAVCGNRGCEFCPAARRQELVDQLEQERAPVWDQAGTVDVRVLAAGVAVVALVVALSLFWPYLVAAAVMAVGWRTVTAHTRRRRPRSSWSSLGRTAAAMYAAWNSRWLKGSSLRVSVPAKAGREHVCGECGHDDTVPF